jgi:hypothetical protein
LDQDNQFTKDRDLVTEHHHLDAASARATVGRQPNTRTAVA